MTEKNILNIIKDKMKDFKEIKGDISLDKWENRIPLFEIIHPDLIGYLFNAILGYDVKYRIFEKINYIIPFIYKETTGRIWHSKLSFNLEIDKEYQNEVLLIFKDIKSLLEELFLEKSKEAITNDRYMLVNNFQSFIDRISHFEIEIDKKQEILNKMETGELPDRDIKRGKTKSGEWMESISLSFPVNKGMAYDIEAYIDAIFSFLEHTITLVSAFTNYKTKYGSFRDFSLKDWMEKFCFVFTSDTANNICRQLSDIKQLYRNPISHGNFSKEYKINIAIDKLGNYPLFVGKKLRGFKFIQQLNYKDFLRIKGIFIDLVNLFKTEYSLQYKLIESGLGINLDVEIYKDALESENAMERFIEYVNYQQDNQLNMDW